MAPSRAPVSSVKATRARLRSSISVRGWHVLQDMPDLVDGRHGPLGDGFGDLGLLVGQGEILGIGRGQVRSIAVLRAEPMEERAQGVECGKDRAAAQSFTRAWTDMF